MTMSRLDRIFESHVERLNALVAAWRQDDRFRDRTIPWFDPDDGGVAATTLLLLEAPAPRTAALRAVAFCSEDNADRTNQILKAQRHAAGLARRSVVKWNVVPWSRPWHDEGALRLAHVDAAAWALHAVLDELKTLRLVITFGVRADVGFRRVMRTVGPGHRLDQIAVPHPSPRNAANRAETMASISDAFARARRLSL